MKTVLILGLGNILLQDEGLGVRAVESLKKMELPDNIELIDGGTAGADLLNIIADRQKVIIIDCMDGDTSPGTIKRFPVEHIEDNSEEMVSLHEFGLLEAIALARQVNCAPKEMVIFGIQPKSIKPGLVLSEEVEAAIPKATGMILEEINAMGPDPL